MLVAVLSVVAAMPLVLSPVSDETVTLKVMSQGAMSKFGYYSPIRLMLSADKPTTLEKMPEGVASPQFGVVSIAAEGKRVFHVVLDEPGEGTARLFVDSNGDGDLTNDPAAVWAAKETTGKDGAKYKQYNGSFTLDLGTPEAPMVVSLSSYRFDKNDPSRASLKGAMLYYRDYATEGEMKLGEKTYFVMLNDNNAGGDFRGRPIPDMPAEKDSSGVQLAIDINGNGKFDKRGEAFDVRKPFNIAGTTYEIREMARNGMSFKVAKSDKTVAEVPLAPDHAVGSKITAFAAKDMDGKDVKFPGDYKGKIVMIDFWATWCGPCMLEVPGLVKAYEKYHDKGFEVLGVTLDAAGDREKILSVTKDKKMTWRQVFDGKGWKAEIALLYVVDSIPATWLVDGDTGVILAASNQLRGERLEQTIADAIKRKFPQ